MSMTLEMTIMEQLHYKRPEELYNEIKSDWPIKNDKDKLKRARVFIEDYTGVEIDETVDQWELE